MIKTTFGAESNLFTKSIKMCPLLPKGVPIDKKKGQTTFGAKFSHSKMPGCFLSYKKPSSSCKGRISFKHINFSAEEVYIYSFFNKTPYPLTFFM